MYLRNALSWAANGPVGKMPTAIGLKPVCTYFSARIVLEVIGIFLRQNHASRSGNRAAAALIARDHGKAWHRTP